MKLNTKVKVKTPDLEVVDELLEQETVDLLKLVDYTGTVVGLYNDLIHVQFRHNNIEVLQVYKAHELEVIE